MIVTGVRLRIDLLQRHGSRLLAMGSVVIDGVFQIEYIKVVRKPDGTLLVQMPSQISNDGVRRDVAHPITREARAAIDLAVLSEYNRLVGLTDSQGSVTIVK